MPWRRCSKRCEKPKLVARRCAWSSGSGASLTQRAPATWSVPSSRWLIRRGSVGTQDAAHLLQYLDRALDAVAPTLRARASRAVAHGIAPDTQWIMVLERLRRSIPRVAHVAMDGTRPVRRGGGARASADGLI